jgi:hypothetical protein
MKQIFAQYLQNLQFQFKDQEDEGIKTDIVDFALKAMETSGVYTSHSFARFFLNRVMFDNNRDAIVVGGVRTGGESLCSNFIVDLSKVIKAIDGNTQSDTVANAISYLNQKFPEKSGNKIKMIKELRTMGANSLNTAQCDEIASNVNGLNGIVGEIGLCIAKKFVEKHFFF